MKRWIFLENSFESEKTPEEVSNLLNSVTALSKPGFYISGDSEFIGKVGVSEFKIVRNIAYRNSFIPIIKGSIEGSGDGAKIHIYMRMNPVVSVFFAIGQSILALVLLFGIIVIMSGGWTDGMLITCVTLLMLILIQVMIRACFFIPAKKDMRRLRELLG